MGLKGRISIDADSGPLGYVLWYCGSRSHDFFTFIQIGSGHKYCNVNLSKTLISCIFSQLQFFSKTQDTMRRNGRMVSQIWQDTKKLQIKYANEGNVRKIGWAKLCKFWARDKGHICFYEIFLQSLVKSQKPIIKIQGKK